MSGLVRLPRYVGLFSRTSQRGGSAEVVYLQRPVLGKYSMDNTLLKISASLSACVIFGPDANATGVVLYSPSALTDVRPYMVRIRPKVSSQEPDHYEPNLLLDKMGILIYVSVSSVLVITDAVKSSLVACVEHS